MSVNRDALRHNFSPAPKATTDVKEKNGKVVLLSLKLTQTEVMKFEGSRLHNISRHETVKRLFLDVKIFFVIFKIWKWINRTASAPADSQYQHTYA